MSEKNPYSDLIDAYVNDSKFKPSGVVGSIEVDADLVDKLKARIRRITKRLKAAAKASDMKKVAEYRDRLNHVRNKLENAKRGVFVELDAEIDDMGLAVSGGFDESGMVGASESIELDESIPIDDLKLQEKINDHMDEVFYNEAGGKSKHSDIGNYYLGFIPYGGRAIYIPAGYEVQTHYTNLWNKQYRDDFMWRYVAIKKTSIYKVNIPYTNIELSSDMSWSLYPILPHLAYVNYYVRDANGEKHPPKWWKDYKWVLRWKRPYNYWKAKNVFNGASIFDYETYYEMQG